VITNSGNWFNGGTGVKILLGAATVPICTQLVLADGDGIEGLNRGEDPNEGAKGTVIQACPTFPTYTPLVRLGNGSGAVYGTYVRNLTLDCNGVAGCTPLYSTDINQNSGAEGIHPENFSGNTDPKHSLISAGIDIDASATCQQPPCSGAAQNCTRIARH
jgi:hypothetical protein